MSWTDLNGSPIPPNSQGCNKQTWSEAMVGSLTLISWLRPSERFNDVSAIVFGVLLLTAVQSHSLLSTGKLRLDPQPLTGWDEPFESTTEANVQHKKFRWLTSGRVDRLRFRWNCRKKVRGMMMHLSWNLMIRFLSKSCNQSHPTCTTWIRRCFRWRRLNLYILDRRR